MISEPWINPALCPYIEADAIPLDRPLPRIPRRGTKMKKDDRVYLEHIGESIRKIQEYTVGGKDSFVGSTLVQDATLRNLQTMAQSTQKLSGGFKARHPSVDWDALSGFRDRLAHGYLGGIDLDRVWDVIESRLPELGRVVAAALKQGR